MLPITLATAAISALIYVGLSIHVVRGRVSLGVGLGDGGKPEMLTRIRTHGNFAEYVPLALILLGLLEMSGGNRTMLMTIGAALIVVRLIHIAGLTKGGTNIFRVVGASGTFLLLIVEAVYGLTMLA